MKHETAGDPMSGLKWTRRTTAKIAAELHAFGIQVSDRTVAGLLKKMGFSLRVNHKKLSGSSHPDRDAQFSRIAELREHCATEHLPVISVDTKKKELIGTFKNQGTKWDREPVLVNDHDFRSNADGIAVPYGIYDVQSNRGTLFVSKSYDTPEFAVDCIENWWRTEGQLRYPNADTLTILADGGGSNGSNCRAWKNGLQHRLCNRHGLTTHLEHRSGIRLSIACSVNSAKTGQAAHWIVSKPYSSMLARPLHVRGCAFAHDRSKGTIRRASRSPMQKCRCLGTIRRASRSPMQKCRCLLSKETSTSLSGTTRSDPTENRKLFFRRPLGQLIAILRTVAGKNKLYN